MKNDDRWDLDGKAGPALPLSDEALNRLVGGAVDEFYGAPTRGEAKSGFASGRFLVGVVGIGVAACVVAGWSLRGSAGARDASPTASTLAAEAPAVTTAATPLPLVVDPMPSVDVQALPQAPSAAERSVRPVIGSPEVSRDLLREANRLRAERRWDEASVLYRRVASVRSEESTAATLALASLRLEHQNNPQEARRLYRAVERAQPEGPLAEEARWGLAMACRALGDTGEERAALEVFLARHPSSLSAPKATKRLAELGAGHEVTP